MSRKPRQDATGAAPSARPRRGPAAKRKARHEKLVNIALQGGGAHGAFTWGVLDKLFEDDRIWIRALSGTSAGAMNAVVAAHGMHEGGAEGARRHLRDFWRAVSRAGMTSPIQRSAVSRFMGNWSLSQSPSYVFFDMLTRVASPYDLNPLDYNPLRDLVDEMVDFDRVRNCGELGVYVSATNVETGRVRVFDRTEISLDAVMASACLPSLYKAVEIDGVPYWDGGFMGNPPLFPFFKRENPSNDVVIIQINPVVREGVPRSATEIQNRVNEITFNSSLLHNLRAIDFVSRLLDEGKLDPQLYKKVNLHIIHDRKRMRPLDASSKLNAEWAFLCHLFEIGRDAASRWLEDHYDDLGLRSSVDIREMFTGQPDHH